VRLRVLLVDDGLDGIAGPVATVLRDAGLGTVSIARQELATVSPADVVILRMVDADPIAACWRIHREGHRWIVAIDPHPNPDDCVRLLNAGVDTYVSAEPGPELVARLRSFLRLRAWAEVDSLQASTDATAREYAPR
jgi:DNA-binding response OmpR family regulator